MARKQATSRKKTTSRKKRTTKASQQVSTRSLRVSGALMILIAALGLFKLGFVGAMIGNVVRIFWGDAYQIGIILELSWEGFC